VSGANVHHWRNQRISALVLIPLTLWFVAAIYAHLCDDHAQFVAWLSRPLPALLMAALVVSAAYHFAVGVREVLVDYVQDPRLHRLSKSAVYLGNLALTLIALAALAKIWLGG
jgi:succinate dehydrogenase membrane anchor subunit